MDASPINVLFSREYSQLGSALKVLSSEKFNVLACPTINIAAVEKNQKLKSDFTQAVTADYLIFTSQYAVIETIAFLKHLGISASALKSVKICAVGPMVARQLSEYGLIADMIPSLYTAESLGDLFPRIATDSLKIFFPKGNRAALKLEQVLAEKGYSIIAPIIYQTTLRESLEKPAQALFDSKSVDCFVFTSPSSVLALTSILNTAKNEQALKNTVLCAIGTTTYQACVDAGLTVSIMPKEFTIEGLARAIDSYYLHLSGKDTDKNIHNN